MDYIPEDKLIVGEKYYCDARNFTVGFWDGEAFIYMRRKFGLTFEDKEYHWDKDPKYGTVKPLELLGE